MKNIKKIAVLIMTLVLLVQALPATAASTSTFAGTHWYVSSVSSDYLYLLDSDSRALIQLLSTVVDLVPYQSWLQGYSLYAVYIGLDLNSNGRFTLTMLCSQCGQIDYSTYGSLSGTWYYSDNTLYLNANGGVLPLRYSGGALHLSLYDVVEVEIRQA